MSQAPSMPMYWDAYIADTTHLTTEEHGAYLLLLGAMWRRNGWVPEDDKDLARIIGLPKAKWVRTKERLRPFLIFENEHISQKKLLEIWENTQEKIEKNRANGALGGRPKSNKTKGIAKANGSVSQKPNKTIPEPEPEPDIKREAKASPKKQNDFDLFWAEVPRKVSKGTAEKAFAKAIKLARPEVIIAGMRRYAESREGEDHQYTAHPATWLNGQRWLDEAAPKDDFHDQVTRMLKGEVNGLQRENAGVDGSPKRLSAPVQETGPSGQRDAAGGDEGDGGGDQLPHIRLIRPKRF